MNEWREEVILNNLLGQFFGGPSMDAAVQCSHSPLFFLPPIVEISMSGRLDPMTVHHPSKDGLTQEREMSPSYFPNKIFLLFSRTFCSPSPLPLSRRRRRRISRREKMGDGDHAFSPVTQLSRTKKICLISKGRRRRKESSSPLSLFSIYPSTGSHKSTEKWKKEEGGA